MDWADADPMGVGPMDMERTGAGLTGTDQKGTDSMGPGCERRSGTGD